MEKTKQRIALAASIAVAGIAVGCGGGAGGSAGISTSLLSASTMGSARVSLTDAPACGYDHVFVTVTKVRIHQSANANDSDSGWTDITLNPARKIDLLNLTNGTMEILGVASLAAGHYSQIRLVLADSSGAGNPNSVFVTGISTENVLEIPSGSQSGIKVNLDFDVTQDQTADVVLDFDACQSIALKGQSGRYMLRPVVAGLPAFNNGIGGQLDPSLRAAHVTVSAQQGGKVVRATTADATSGNFFLPRMPVGTYDVVFVADGHPLAVVTGVPVQNTTDNVTIGRAGTLINWPATTEPANSISGLSLLVPSVVDDSGTVSAQQTLNTTTVTLRGVPADLQTHAYTLAGLPTANPVIATFNGSLPPVFAPVQQVAPGVGKYMVSASAAGYKTQTNASVDISVVSQGGVNFSLIP